MKNPRQETGPAVLNLQVRRRVARVISGVLSMRRRTVLIGELVILTALVLAALILPYRAPAPVPIDASGALPLGTSGFYDLEHSGGAALRWSGTTVLTHFENVAPDQRYELGLLVAAGPRPENAPPPDVAISVKGKQIYTFQANPDWTLYTTVVEPQGFNWSNELDLALTVPSFIPREVMAGNADARSLGILVQRISLEPIPPLLGRSNIPFKYLVAWLLVAWLAFAITRDPRFALKRWARWTPLIAGLGLLAIANRFWNDQTLGLAGWVFVALLLMWIVLREGAAAPTKFPTDGRDLPTATDGGSGTWQPSQGIVRSGQKIPQLDGIRGIAILLVIVYHYVYGANFAQDGLVGDLVRNSLNLWWSGVDLFFVLSGFLIGGILIDNRSSINYFKTFYIRRICRIFPLYFAWLLLFVCIRAILSRYFPDSIFAPLFTGTIPIRWFATFTMNIAVTLGQLTPALLGPLWSLSVEEQFYLAMSLIVAFVSIRKLPYVVIILAGAAPVIRLLLLIGGQHMTCLACYQLMPTRADALLLGVMGAYALRQPRVVQYLLLHLKSLYVALAFLLAGVVALNYAQTTMQFHPDAFPASSIGYSLLAVFFLCILLVALLDPLGRFARLTSIRSLRQLGTVAYGVYVVHLPIFHVFNTLILSTTDTKSLINYVLVVTLALASTMIIAGLSWKYFEKKIQAWGHNFKYGEPRRAVTLDAAPLGQAGIDPSL